MVYPSGLAFAPSENPTAPTPPVLLTTLTGTYLYRVIFAKVVEPEDIWVLDHSDGSILTLVTCYPFFFVGPAPQRFIVRAHRSPG